MKSKKNILILPADFYPNNTGFSNATRNLIESVKNNQDDIHIHVFTTVDLGESQELENIKVVRYKEDTFKRKIFLLINNYKKYRYLKKYIDGNDIDFILLETNTFTILQSLLVKEYKNILGVRIHSTADTEVLMYAERKKITSKILKWLDVKFMKDTKYIISTNNYHLDFVKNIMFRNNVYTTWSDKDYFILPNTVVLKRDTLVKANGNETGNYLLSMGKLSNNGYVQKGLKDLIKALYILKENGEIPDGFLLKIVGDGEKRDELIEYARRLNVYAYIEFIKKTTHIETLELIKKSRAVILLSRYEGQSMFITETIAIGKPIIITHNNGMKDMIIRDENGFVVEEGDYLGASDAIKRIYNISPDRLYKMGEKSREIFESKFSPEKNSKSFMQIVNMVISNNKYISERRVEDEV